MLEWIETTQVETGRVVRTLHEHTKKINALSWNKDKYFLLTGSADCTAILWDAVEWTVLKVYETDRPVNAVGFSPIKEHVLVAGGQEAMNVTTTSAKVGKFETKLYHAVFGEEFANVRGHFGPINSIAVSPDGRGYVEQGGRKGKRRREGKGKGKGTGRWVWQTMTTTDSTGHRGMPLKTTTFCRVLPH